MTTMTRRDAFQNALSLRETVNRMFEENLASGSPARSFVPALNLSETTEAYFVELAVPGLRSEDLNVTFENGVLTLSGEIRQSEEQKERSFHRVERRYGNFSRSVSLPVTVRGDAIEAKLEGGLLNLSIPKAEEVKPRKINVSVG